MRVLLRLIVRLLPLLALGTTVAEAHPHVWITATSELIYAPDGSITGVRHARTFDDMFAAYALQGLALAHALTAGASGRAAILATGYGLCVLFGGWPLVLAALAGVADALFNIRAKRGLAPTKA